MASQACLSIPQYWSDPTLLLEEPFLTEFMIRQEAGESRRKGEMKWPRRIAEQVLQVPGGKAAVSAWVKIAFRAIKGEEQKVSEERIFDTLNLTEFFVEVYWLIRQNGEDKALLYLNSERKRRGFTYDLGHPSRAKPPGPSNLENRDQGNHSIEQKTMDVDGPTDRAGHSSSVLNEVTVLEEEQGKIPVISHESISGIPQTGLVKDDSISTKGRKRANSDGSSIPATTIRRRGRPKGQQTKARRPPAVSNHKTEVSRRLALNGSRVAGGGAESSSSTRGSVNSAHASQSTQSSAGPRKRRCYKTDEIHVASNTQPKPERQSANRVNDRLHQSPLAPSRPDPVMEQLNLSVVPYSTTHLAHPSGSVVQSLSLQSGSTAQSPATHTEVNYRGDHVTPLPTQPMLHDQPINQQEFKMPNSEQEQTDESKRSSVADAPLQLHRVGSCSPWPNWNQDTWDTDNSFEEQPEIPLIDEGDLVTVRDHGPDPRPLLTGYPPIWAESRQELCESFPFFRSYQGGVYFANDAVKGYLLSGFAASRDLFHHNGKLIISHGGGKSESVHENRTAEDQTAHDRSVRALLANYKDRRPLALIADDRYKLFPFNLAGSGYTYVVLGFYVITQVWAEYQPASNERDRVVRYKFAFQWCPSQGEPWWTKQMPICNDLVGSDHVSENRQETLDGMSGRETENKAEALPDTETVSRSYLSRCLYEECKQCRMQTPQVYSQGWVCLTPECPEFWKMKNEPPDRFPVDLVDIFPAPPPAKVPDDITTTYTFTRGLHCRRCGRLSCRYKWQHWECSNCQTQYKTCSRVRGPKEFWGQLDNTVVHQVNKSSGISKPFSRMYDAGPGLGNGEYIQFVLPGGRGCIHLLRGNPRINKMADKIFEEYQIEAYSGELQFRRYPLRMHKCRGTLLTNYFSQNSGEPYQYVGGTGNTTPFSVAPGAVKAALDLIQTRAGIVIKSKPKFNEILSAAYMERQKMAFHSDSERGLGPTVASLSLGSAAVMHFRPSAYLQEGREIILTLHLQHGDVLVMDGAGIQECYEHTVVPCNFRIAATARWIGTGHR